MSVDVVAGDRGRSVGFRHTDRSEVARRAVAAVRRGGALLVGDAGVGKSHLARLLARRLRTAGADVELILATESASEVPFGALAGLLEAETRTRGDVLDVLRTARSLLKERPSLVVVVDDAHRLDPASAALLLQLVLRNRLRLLVTMRAGMPAPDAVTALWKDAGLERFDLDPLSESEVGVLARVFLDAPLERETRAWLWRTSAGNPLFAHELLRHGRDSGALALEHGHWRRVGPFSSPRRLLDLLGGRIEALAAAERRALAAVAFAEPIGEDSLRRLGALPSMRALEEQALVESAPAARGLRFRLAHSLYGEVVVAAMTATERAALHADLAPELDLDQPSGRLRLASWALEDGRAPDVRLLLSATNDALAAFDTGLAIRLGEAAVQAAPGLAAALPLAAALRAAGRFEEAEQRLASVEAETVAADRVTEYLWLRATTLQWGLGRAEDAHALVARIAAAGARPRTCDAIAAALLSSSGQLGAAAARAQRTLDDPAAGGQAHAIAAVVAGHVLPELGDPQAGLAAVDLVESGGAPESEWPRAAVAVMAAFFAGEQWAQRRARLDARHAAACAAGDDATAAICELVSTRLALPAGDLVLARQATEDALARLAFADPRALAPICHAGLAEIAAYSGDAAQAREALEQGRALLATRIATPMAEGYLATASVVVLAAEGELSRAQDLALRLAHDAGEAVHVAAEMRHLFMRVGGDPARVAALLNETAQATRGGIVTLWARQAAAAASRDGAALEATASDYEKLGALLFAAECWSQAAAAAASTDARRRREGRAAHIAAACGARALPLVIAARVAPLTRREREVAQLIARGHSNAEVARRLSLSVRTVESHAYRASVKLGIRDRSAFAAALAPSDPQAGAA